MKTKLSFVPPIALALTLQVATSEIAALCVDAHGSTRASPREISPGATP